MAGMTLAYGAASAAALCAAMSAFAQRFGSAPIPAAQGTTVPAANPSAHLGYTPSVDRKADDRVPPRGRRL